MSWDFYLYFRLSTVFKKTSNGFVHGYNITLQDKLHMIEFGGLKLGDYWQMATTFLKVYQKSKKKSKCFITGWSIVLTFSAWIEACTGKNVAGPLEMLGGC
jgi:hypothetical protein